MFSHAMKTRSFSSKLNSRLIETNGDCMQIAGDIGITHMVQLIKAIVLNPNDYTQVGLQ